MRGHNQQQQQKSITSVAIRSLERTLLLLLLLKNRIPAHFYLNFTDRYGRFTQKYAKIRKDTDQYAWYGTIRKFYLNSAQKTLRGKFKIILRFSKLFLRKTSIPAHSHGFLRMQLRMIRMIRITADFYGFLRMHIRRHAYRAYLSVWP